MRISHRHRFIFFSFPKTGSVSLREVLDPVSDIKGAKAGRVSRDADGELVIPTHIRPADLRTIFEAEGWPFDEYFRFMFVRNPWSRLVSLHRMIGEVEPGFDQPFDQWLLASRPDGRGGGGPESHNWRRYGSYSVDAFACDASGTRLVDAVYRLEDMTAVLATLRGRGIPVEADVIPTRNMHPPANLEEYYPTPMLKTVVAMRYAKDIAEFGYRFPTATEAR